MKIAVDKVIPNPEQPRTEFDEAELAGLAQSIVENGLIQPIVVEAVEDAYILVDGERRLRAHKLANLTEIEAVIKPEQKDAHHRLTQALVANIQRASMGYVDEAKAYKKLLEEHGTLEAVAQKVGVSSATISSRLSLLELSPGVQTLYNKKRLPFDVSLIAMFKKFKPDDQERMALTAATRGWRTETILRIGRRQLNMKGKKEKPRGIVKAMNDISVEFDALALTNGKKLPAGIRKAAKATCKACALYAEASAKICWECPLPDFLKKYEGE